jgi:hypothetical protein
MMHQLKGRLTYSNVMATVAVFVALGGTSYAAIKLPKNSVGSTQIKSSAVRVVGGTKPVVGRHRFEQGGADVA